MRYIILTLIAVMLMISLSNKAHSDAIWDQVKGIKEAVVKEVSCDKETGSVYVASPKRVYKTSDSGLTWKQVLAVSANNSINYIGVSRAGVFVLTEKGVFKSEDSGASWEKVFKSSGEKDSPFHINFSKDNVVYLGTGEGLFISRDEGSSWQKGFDEAGDLNVKWIEFLGKDVYMIVDKGVYKETENGWDRVFVTTTEDILYDPDVFDEDQTSLAPINSMLVEKDKMFLATDIGVFTSVDNGKNWPRLPLSGLISQKIKRLLVSDNDLFALSDKGVFVLYDNSKVWNELYKGLADNRTWSFSQEPSGLIWLSTNKGVYKSNIKASSFSVTKIEKHASIEEFDKLKHLFKNEPTILQVQEKAIDYAEVHPDKIRSWRGKASINAVLPELSLDYDKTVTYDSGSDRYYTGPRDWGVSLKWDLADLIWNAQQTSIDTRSKLMVQLRDDIMDEVTRVYFERRRVQIEKELSPPSNKKEGIELNLRIQELT
ncbi:MAG: hypothetical protein ABH848_04405, partial [Candidatus Omnitrophota bacterium]